jgi:hypothetical protein
VVEHRALQARLDAASVAVAVVPGSCASPLVAKQFIGEPTIRELAIEWCHESTLSTLLTTLCMCAMSNKPVRLLSETQLDTLVGWQLAAFATRMLGASSAAFGFCDEDEAHRFNNVAELRDGALGWPHAAGVSGGLTTQAFVEFNVTQQLSQQQQQQQQQYNNGGDASSLNVKRARVDDVSAAPPPPPTSYAMPPPPPFDPYSAASQNNNAMATSNYGASVPAVATSGPAGGTSQCFGCKQFGHMVRDCPVAQASGRSDMCFQCGQSGHWASACPRRMPKGVCYNCGSAGHMSPACPQRPAGVAATPQGHIRCYVCQQYGHAAKSCPSTQQQQQQGQFFR